MMSRLKKASQITESNITPIYIDSELIQIEVKSGNNCYQVSCNGDLWRCDCFDFSNRGVNREEGSFMCKHCLAVVNYLMNTPVDKITSEIEIRENLSNNIGAIS